MARLFYKLSLALSLLAFQACEDPVLPDFNPAEPQLVLHSSFTEGKAVEVVVSKSRPVLDKPGSNYVLNAKVEIYSDSIYLETLELVMPKSDSLGIPYYTTRRLIPRAGVLYTLKVEAPGCRPVFGESRIPKPINLISANVSGFGIQQDPNPEVWSANYDLHLSFEDPAMEENFYHIRLKQQILEYEEAEGDTLITNSYIRPLLFSPEDNNNLQVAHVEGGILLTDGVFNGTLIHYSLPLQVRLKRHSELIGKLFVELRAVSEEYFLYYAGVSRQYQQNESPFAEPVIIYDNIEGGGGIFAGYNLSLDSLLVTH